MDFKNKNVLVLGAGMSGFASCELLKALCANVYISDHDRFCMERLAREQGVTVLNDDNLTGINLIVISPGISIHSEIVVKAKKLKIKVISELELGFLNCKSPIIAITGTNGKTSTTKLTAGFLTNAGLGAYSLGNIGYPVSAAARGLYEHEVAVVEVSSFQLEAVHEFHPHIAILLNITPDHLDRHRTMREYINAKMKIFANMNKKDYAIINADDKNISENTAKIPCPVYRFSLHKKTEYGTYINKNHIYFANGELLAQVCCLKALSESRLNIYNALALITLSGILNIPFHIALRAVSSFMPEPYTIEPVGEYKKIKIFNDSKGTNTGATLSALQRMKGRTVVIMGGRDKGENYTDFFVQSPAVHYIFCGENSDKLVRTMKKLKLSGFTVCSSLHDAVIAGFAELGTKSGNLLFSPACASFDKFLNYKERGKYFNILIGKLLETE